MKHDLKWFMTELKRVCQTHLIEESNELLVNDNDIDSDSPDLGDNNSPFPVTDPSKLWFSILNEEVEGYYLELKEISNVSHLADVWITKYNE